MPKPDVQIFENPEAMSNAAAARFVELAGKHDPGEGIFSCALSGGSTPRRMFQLLAERPVTWENIHLFQVDERCVPPDDSESNYRSIRETLLSKVELAQANFHRMVAEKADRDAASRDYQDELARMLHPAAGDFPRLNLVFLGIGADGHTASLFPGSKALDERTRWVCPNFSPTHVKHRLTLTYPVLNAAQELIFLVSEGSKAETLRQILEGPRAKFPAQGIEPVNGRLRWFVDRAAADRLSESIRSGS